MSKRGNARPMKKLLTALSLAASLAACATAHGQGGDVNARPGVKLGTVESVELVRTERDIHAFEETLELRIKPEVTEQLVIRLDEGGAVIVTVKGAQRFEAGERVRVVSQTYGPYGPRVEHE